MSEIKGQLLGILLVAAIFSAIGGSLYVIFNDLTKTVSDKVTETANGFNQGSTSEEVVAALNPDDLLTY